MKAFAIGSLAAMLACGAAFAQPAGAPAKPQSPMKHGPTVCLWTNRIDHTSVKDARTIIFYMKNGKAWKNTLWSRCPGLLFSGFAYVTRDGRICSNMQSIYVLKTGGVCVLGNFTSFPGWHKDMKRDMNPDMKPDVKKEMEKHLPK
jgi:hypothetical protein